MVEQEEVLEALPLPLELVMVMETKEEVEAERMSVPLRANEFQTIQGVDHQNWHRFVPLMWIVGSVDRYSRRSVPLPL